MADVAAVARNASTPNIARYMNDNWPTPYTQDDARRWLSALLKPTSLDHSFAMEVDGEAAGSIGLTLDEKDPRKCEIGYWLGERFWGRGITTDAARAMIEHAFIEHGMTRLEAVAFAQNSGSIRVLEKVGFLLERVEERAAVRDGVVLDDRFYALVR